MPLGAALPSISVDSQHGSKATRACDRQCKTLHAMQKAFSAQRHQAVSEARIYAIYERRFSLVQAKRCKNKLKMPDFLLRARARFHGKIVILIFCKITCLALCFNFSIADEIFPSKQFFVSLRLRREDFLFQNETFFPRNRHHSTAYSEKKLQTSLHSDIRKNCNLRPFCMSKYG